MSDGDLDRELVERAQRGDRNAFGLLVSKYERRVLRLLSRMIRDPAEVEDVAQDAFVRAWRALPSFRGDSAFYTWLYRIAINTAKNWLGAARRRPLPLESPGEGDDTEAPDALAQDVATPESMLLSKQVGEAVNRAIEALPEDLRTALVLRELEGLSYEEIAAAMACPIGTVRSRIFRAREAVAEALRPLLDRTQGRRW